MNETGQAVDVAKAKQFLIDRVVRQAAEEGVELTSDERLLLDFSEPASEELLAAARRVDEAKGEAAYEAKIVGLLRRARESDEAQGVDDWERAIETLDDVDCYLMVMIDQAFRGSPTLSDESDDNVIPGPSNSSMLQWFVALLSAVVLANLNARLPRMLMSVLWALWMTLTLMSLRAIIRHWRH